MTPRRTDGGFSLVEALVAAAVLVVALLTMIPLSVKMISTSSDANHRSTAAGLASRQVESVRKLNISANPGALPLGASTRHERVGDTVYTIQQNVTLSDNTTTTSICLSSGSANLAYKLVRVKVDWPNRNVRTAPAYADTLKALGVGTDEGISGGVAAILVRGADGAVSGVPVTLSGNGTALTPQTGDDGCVVFSDLDGSTYTATAQLAGYVGTTNAQQATAPVIGLDNGSIARVPISYAAARSLPFDLVKDAGTTIAAGLDMHVGGTFVADAVPATCATAPTALCTDAVPGTIQNLYPDNYTVRAGDCIPSGQRSSGTVSLTSKTVPATLAIPLGTYTVTVTTLLGAPVAGRTVNFTSAAGSGCSSGEVLTGVTNAAGVAAIALPYGKWSISTTSVGAGVGTVLSVGARPVNQGASPSNTLQVIA